MTTQVHDEEWARSKERPYVGRWDKRPHDPSLCCATVVEPGRGIHFHQCTRKPKVFYGSLGYCSQHDPVAAEARREKRHQEYQAKYSREAAVWREEERIKKLGVAATAALKRIAAGHNDPANFAASVLREHGEVAIADALEHPNG